MTDGILIADLGLGQPANAKPSQSDNKQIYGVLPYVAPEVLQGNEILKQVIFMDLELLHMKSLTLDIIKQCWDADPLKRPKAKKLWNLFYDLCYNELYKENSLINEQISESDETNKQLSSLLSSANSNTTHPQAIYTSRLLDFKNLPEPKYDDNDNSFAGDLESTGIDFIKLKINSKDENN